jgi:hypothetical protein
MITNHQQLLVSLEQLQELELALASVKREGSSPTALIIQATSIQKEVYRIRHEIDVYLGVADLHIATAAENTARESKLPAQGAPEVQQQRSLLELEGLGAALWQEIDAQHYVEKLRKEWDQRP